MNAVLMVCGSRLRILDMMMYVCLSTSSHFQYVEKEAVEE